MIRKVVIRRFKRFDEVEFEFPRHVVLAGPNNSGKTSALQAIAAWSLAFDRWKQLNDFQRHGGAYAKAPITRPQFSAVPLRAFELLWRDRHYRGNLQVEIHDEGGWKVPIEFITDTTEQIYVRPLPSVEPATLRQANLSVAFIPPMTGLSTEEPEYKRPKVDQLLGQAKPGEVLRNLLVEAASAAPAWNALTSAMQRLFGCTLLPPDATGANILAEYQSRPNGPRLDIASAGSGFQQVLMLLTFLHTRSGSVLLLDEPDAHLHVILQDAIYGELRRVASEKGSQLVIATHSEIIINSVDPRELCVMLQRPRMLVDTDERRTLVDSLGILSHTDIMLAEQAPGVLYVENYTDLELLRTWARVLGHPARELLEPQLFWRPTVGETRPGAAGIPARDHYDALKLTRQDLPALEILDGDARPEIESTPITGKGFQRIRWRRCEVESYLVHPEVLARFVEAAAGGPAAGALQAQGVRQYFQENFPPGFLKDPFGQFEFIDRTKARTKILPPALTAGGLPGFPYTRYHEIAAAMTPDEVHPEVVEKLDAICQAFGRG